MLGYACMNNTLRDREPPLRCNRDMQQATFEERGLSYVSELARQNMQDLHAILAWNVEHDIYFYRCTSTLVPWNSQFDLPELPDYERLRTLAKRCGAIIRDNDMRFTFHPDYWCRLGSDTRETRENSVDAVEYHADWLDLVTSVRPHTTPSRHDWPARTPDRRPTPRPSPRSLGGSPSAPTS